ncbi:cytochrome P450 4C1-like isoform X2 [Eriocheir sinensis]|uniref:cytochrome P450 4C1-like isoform X2 n=1 Tax=Eriocheir sinensis TaxID=95602 RepID=UPI0021C9C042|nr:cytochrome P450 4C1-like isoform X2 [Eriocheir sinensis]XP_050722917.1 cytochrome P450 4C1-like isoform X2 [Eriocheir sinensis]XP_050722918.1 cytochrome P450 4C1-like isoform X2 [Eriocheir sinensis]XP_050722919.1 cytochrome P450 4C1-like isoform X2 [Eriocheir sinensis]
MSWLRSRTEWMTDHGVATTLACFAFTLLAGFLITKLIKRRQKVWLLDQLPGPKGLPLLGCVLEVACDNVELFRRLNSHCDMGGVVRVWYGPEVLVLLSSPRAAEVMLTSQKNIDKSNLYQYLYPWLGTGLLTSTGSKWHSRRKLLTPAFHFTILNDFVEVFSRQSSKLVSKLRGKANGEPFDIFPIISLCTLDIICEAAMGRTVNSQDEEDSEYVRAVKRMNYLLHRRMLKVWQHPDFMFRLLGLKKEHDACLEVLHKFSRETIRERKRLYSEAKKRPQECPEEERLLGGGKKRLAFLDLLLEASEDGKVLSDEDIREEVDTFMFEGHDTTSSGINWALYFMGRNPELQARVQEELDSIFGDSDRPATMEDLKQMKYLENCIKESHRILPSVPFFGRELNEDLIIDNQRVPAGVTVLLMIFKLHRNAEQFPDPDRFDPDRFLPENVAKRHPFAYVPFSAGPRNCIGQRFAMMEEKVALSSVLRNFKVVSDIPESELQLLGELILRPRGGIPLRLLPRST